MQMNFICSSEKPLLHNTINCKLYDEKSWYASAVISHLPLKYKRCKRESMRLVCEMKQIFQKRCLISSLGKFWWVYIKPQECDFLCVCCPGFDCISRAGPNALLGTVSSFVLVKARRKSKADLALKKTKSKQQNKKQTMNKPKATTILTVTLHRNFLWWLRILDELNLQNRRFNITSLLHCLISGKHEYKCQGRR